MTAQRMAIAAGALALGCCTGCSARIPEHHVQMRDGTGSFAVVDDGVVASGSFTLAVDLDEVVLDPGDTSDVYLQRLVLTERLLLDVVGETIIDPADYGPLLAELTGADVPLPYEATVGVEHLARFDWRTFLPHTPASALCDYGLQAEVYVPLGDVIVHPAFGPVNRTRYMPPPIAWETNPCPAP